MIKVRGGNEHNNHRARKTVEGYVRDEEDASKCMKSFTEEQT